MVRKKCPGIRNPQTGQIKPCGKKVFRIDEDDKKIEIACNTCGCIMFGLNKNVAPPPPEAPTTPIDNKNSPETNKKIEEPNKNGSERN
jgi:hypothetical protein